MDRGALSAKGWADFRCTVGTHRFKHRGLYSGKFYF